MAILIFITLFVSSCKEREHTYIKTDRGLMSYSRGYCTLGMLTNNDGLNILDENSNPIVCYGYITLTTKQKNKWVIDND